MNTHSKMAKYIAVGVVVLAVVSVTGYELYQSQRQANNEASQNSPDLKKLTTTQFLSLVASSSEPEKAKLYQAHSRLAFEAGTIMMTHLTGDDFVGAATRTIPELVTNDGWDPTPAGDILVWAILKPRAVTLLDPALWKLSCGKDCPPLTQDQVIAKLKADPFPFSDQEIQGVLAELATEKQQP